MIDSNVLIDPAEDTPRASANMIPRLIMWAALAVVAAFCLYTLFLFPSNYEDDLYNLAVALHSAGPDTHSVLETSFVAWYFKPYPIPRAEDWHRGLSVLILSFWARVLGPNANDVTMRVPHLVWVLAWLALAVRLFTDLVTDGASSLRALLVRRPWLIVLPVGLLTLNQWGIFMLSRAYLDDVPSGVAVLLAIVLLVRRPKVSVRVVIAAGVLCSIGAQVKVLYLLWGGIGALSVFLFALESRDLRGLRRAVSMAALFSLTFFVVLVPRLLWNYHDMGTLLETATQFANRVTLAGGNEHFPYFIYNSTAYQLLPTIFANPALALRSLSYAVRGLAFAWIWLVPILIAARWPGWDWRQRRLMTLMALCVLTYCVFFTAGLGEPGQLRYWIVPVTLVVVLGLHALPKVLEQIRLRPLIGYAGAVVLIGLTFALGWSIQIPQFNLDRFSNLRARPELTTFASQRLSPDAAVMLSTLDAIYYYSLYPAQHVVNFQPSYMTMDAEHLKQFLDFYHIEMAIYPTRLIMPLEANGFVEIAQQSGMSVLARQP